MTQNKQYEQSKIRMAKLSLAIQATIAEMKCPPVEVVRVLGDLFHDQTGMLIRDYHSKMHEDGDE